MRQAKTPKKQHTGGASRCGRWQLQGEAIFASVVGVLTYLAMFSGAALIFAFGDDEGGESLPSGGVAFGVPCGDDVRGKLRPC